MQNITRIAALLLVALAVVLAIVAFGLSRRASKPGPATQAVVGHAPTPERAASPAGPPMVVASDTLPAGQPIAAASLRIDNPSKPAADSYKTVDDVVGDVPLVDIPAGAPVTSGLLAHGVAMQLKPGERALAVPVDELAGAGNRIVPGDYVDVFLNLKAGQSSGIAGTAFPAQTRLLLSRTRVLAYGNRDLPAMQRNDGTGDDKPAKPESNTPPRSAVLAVPLDMASRLLLGAQSGTLSLALRHPDDAGQPDSALFPQPRTALPPLAGLSAEQKQQLATPENRAYAGIDGAGLVGTASDNRIAPRTIPRASSLPSLEIIRGTTRSARRPTP